MRAVISSHFAYGYTYLYRKNKLFAAHKKKHAIEIVPWAPMERENFRFFLLLLVARRIGHLPFPWYLMPLDVHRFLSLSLFTFVPFALCCFVAKIKIFADFIGHNEFYHAKCIKCIEYRPCVCWLRPNWFAWYPHATEIFLSFILFASVALCLRRSMCPFIIWTGVIWYNNNPSQMWFHCYRKPNRNQKP